MASKLVVQAEKVVSGRRQVRFYEGRIGRRGPDGQRRIDVLWTSDKGQAWSFPSAAVAREAAARLRVGSDWSLFVASVGLPSSPVGEQAAAAVRLATLSVFARRSEEALVHLRQVFGERRSVDILRDLYGRAQLDLREVA